jgi:CheY-like chemotaxis protein
MENNQTQAERLRIHLEDAGYQVSLAGNSREGLELMELGTPDLIILNIFLPEMDGFNFLETRNNMTKYAYIPAIVLSAIAYHVEGSPFAADAILTKPIRRYEILQLVDYLLPFFKRDGDKRPKLLIVDNDPSAIKIISSYLPNKYYEVITSFSGSDGIELARAEKPDLVLLDLIMPEISGFEVLMALKDEEKTRDIPVITMTSKIISNEERILLKMKVGIIGQYYTASPKLITAELERILLRYRLK